MNSTIKSCRVCHSETGCLVSPCACEGSIKYVHSSCLSGWVLRKGTLKCEVCGANYTIGKFLDAEETCSPPNGFFALLLVCARRVMRKNTRMFLRLFLCLLIAIFTPIMLAIFHFAACHLLPRGATMNYLTKYLSDEKDLTFVSYLTVGVWLVLVTAPFYLLSEIWGVWCASQEDILRIGNPQDERRTYSNINFELVDLEEEANNDSVDSHKLRPVSLPEENAMVFEVLEASQQRTNTNTTMKEGVPLPIRFCFWLSMFYLYVVLCLEVFPEALRLGIFYLCKLCRIHGFIKVVVKQILEMLSSSEAVACRRYGMLSSLYKAFLSSRMVLLFFSHVRILCLLTSALFLFRRMGNFEVRRKLVSTLTYIRGVMNMMLLFCYILPIISFMTLWFSLDYFTLENSPDPINEENAWSLLGVSSISGFDESPDMTSTHSPITILKALYVFSQSEDTGVCWNYGEGNTAMAWKTNNIEKEEEDYIIFPIFSLIVLLNKMDVFSLVSLSYVAVLIGVFVFYHTFFLATRLPPSYREHIALFRFSGMSIPHMIAILNGKMMCRLIFEILFLTIFISCAFLPHVFLLVHYLDSTVLPIEVADPFCKWNRLLFLLWTPSMDEVWIQNFIEISHSYIISTFMNVFAVESETSSDEQFFSCLFSKVLRWLAFIFSYWVFSTVTMALYLIPCLYLVTKNCPLFQFCAYKFFDIHRVLSLLFPRPFFRVITHIQSLITHWWIFIARWELSCSLGLNIVLRPHQNANGTLMYGMKPCKGIPYDVQRSISSLIEVLSARLTLLEQDEDDDDNYVKESIERIQLIIRLNTSESLSNHFLFKEDIKLLLSVLPPPGLKQVVCFYFISCVVFFFLPLIAGATLLATVRQIFFMLPYCFSGPRVLFLFMLWIFGVFVSLASFSIERGEGESILKRLGTFVHFGRYHFSVTHGFMFVLLPVFMGVAKFTIIPYALSVVKSALLPGWKLSLVSLVALFLTTIVLLGVTLFNKVTVLFWIQPFFLVHSATHEVDKGEEILQSKKSNAVVRQYVPQERKNASSVIYTFLESTQRLATWALKVVLKYILCLLGGAFGYLRRRIITIFTALPVHISRLKEKTITILTKVAEREHVRDVVFMDNQIRR